MVIKEKSYKMYYGYDYIADFVEIYTDFGMELEIRLNDNCDLSLFRFADLLPLQKNRVINTWGVKHWIDERCTSRSYQDIDYKLKLWGLSEYNQLAIMHKCSAINSMDDYWIAFNENATFDENHPNGKNFKCILGD